MSPPSEWAEAEEAQEVQEGGAGAASAVPSDVAAEMRAFVAAVTTPGTELEQQLLEAANQWAARNAVPPATALSAAWTGSAAAAAAMPSHCLVGSSLNNARCSSPRWSSASDAVPVGGATATAAGRAGGAGSSGRSSEEGSSTAWRLCTWLQRQGWPAQHCASFRSGGSGGSASGWRSTSGHEFILVNPHQCRPQQQQQQQQRPGGAAAMATSSGSDSSVDSDVAVGGGAAAAAALVIDPEFATQFALASPSPRYQLVVALLPRLFVGTYARLHQLVEWACCEMQGSFQGSGSGLPPWRSLDQVLNKWRLMGNDDEAGSPSMEGTSGVEVASHVHTRAPPEWGAQPQQQEQQQPAAAHGEHAACGASSASAPAGCGGAFSAEQQEAMLSLLLAPSAAAQGGAVMEEPMMTASSSGSDLVACSMDAARAPRSLLTLELAQLAAAAGEGQAVGGGPAAAILSMAHGSGQQQG